MNKTHNRPLLSCVVGLAMLMCPVSLQGQSIWTYQDTGTFLDFSAVAWSGSLLVAVGQNGLVMTSSTGSDWTARTSVTPNFLLDVAWSGSRFVAVGEGQRPIITSTDGINWSTVNTITSTEFFNGITWSGNQFVAVGLIGLVMTSPDGLTWTRRQTGTTQSFFDVVWTGSQLVAIGTNGTVMTSPNGVTWTPRNSTVTDVLLCGATAGSKIVCGGNSGTTVSGTNGTSWNYHYAGYSLDLTGITQVEKGFVAVGWNFAGCGVFTSEDGDNWVLAYEKNNRLPRDVVWTGSRLVAVGDGGLAMTSETGGPRVSITKLKDRLVFEFTGVLQFSDDLERWTDFSPQPPSPFYFSSPPEKLYLRSR